MKCLMCGKPLQEEGGMIDVLFREDSLCPSCRSTWRKMDYHQKIEGIPALSTWAYEGGFQTSILQYKELYDEALFPIFLEPILTQFRLAYHGYTILCMPSSSTKLKQRGFSHLEKMFSITGLPMMSPFEKIEDQDQEHKSYEERLQMVHGIVLKPNVILPKKLLLVDDVLTTGSTIRGALHCLDSSAHKIRIYTCAYTVPSLKERTHKGIINKRFYEWRTHGKYLR